MMIRNLIRKSSTRRFLLPAATTSQSFSAQPVNHSRRRNRRTTSRHNNNNNNNNNQTTNLVSTDWMLVTGIPPLSSLDEVLIDIERIIKTELKTGIVDLDAAEALIYDQVEKQEGEEAAEEEDGEGGGGDNNSNTPLPLWDPTNHYHENGILLPDHMVIEAHLKLSNLYREFGWYLRFPNRSCVHAIMSHVNEAERIKNQHLKKMKKMKWKEAQHAKKTKWRKDYVRQNDNDDDDVGGGLSHDFNKEMDNFSWMDYETRPLRCGWKDVGVEPLYIAGSKFHSKYDWVDETVVRIENCPPESTVDEMRYFLQKYNLVDESIIFSSGYEEEAENIVGANRRGNLARKQVGVRLVVNGCRNDSKLRQLNTNRVLSTTNTFLAQFVSAADARCAVREKQNVEFMGKKIRLAQFPNQIIP